MRIPHSKPTIGRDELRAVTAALNSGIIAQGPHTRQFEEMFGKFVGMPYAVATNCGTSALHLALIAMKIGPGDEVIMPSYVCTAVLNAVNYVGASARLVDIDADDFNIDPSSAKKAVGRKTKAIIVPHMFGRVADMGALARLGVPIIEDCALSPGAMYKGKRAGSFGLVSVFSFYATKMMTTAEGGMALTRDRALYSCIADLRDYDNKDSYRVRYNYKMSDVTAAIGMVQLKNLSRFISRRQRIAGMYNSGLSDLDIRLPSSDRDRPHTYFRYMIRMGQKAEQIIGRLKRRGIEAKRPVFRPLHRYLGLPAKDFPATEEVHRRGVSLPIYPSMSEVQVKAVIRALSSPLL